MTDKSIKRKYDWIRFRVTAQSDAGVQQRELYCRHCGNVEVVDMSESVNARCNAESRYVNRHKRCAESPTVLEGWHCFPGGPGRPLRSAQSREQSAAVNYHPEVGLTCTAISDEPPATFIVPPAVVRWLTAS